MAIPAYLILSTPRAGRRALCLDACKNAFEGANVCAFIAEGEPPAPEDEELAKLGGVSVARYSGGEDALEKICALDEANVGIVLFLADSAGNLADEVESFKRIADAGKIRLARVWSIVDCKLNMVCAKKAEPYFDALSHFADCLLFSRRGGVPKNFTQALKDKYARDCRPHLMIDMDKFGRVENAMEIAEEQARRISMLFDEFDPADELDIDGDNLPDEPFSLERKPDPYLERTIGGARKNPVPELFADAMKIHENEN